MKDGNKKEIIVTIVSSFLVATITIFMGIIGLKKEIKETIVYVPQLENVNFPDYFGLKKGKVFNYHIYEKEAIPEKGPEYSEKNYTIKVSVYDEIKQGNVSLFLLDNNIIYPTKEKQDHGILLVGNQVYLLDGKNLTEYKRILLGDTSNFKDVPDLKISYILPFFDKQRVTDDTKQLMRKDNLYQDFVNKESMVVHLNGDSINQKPQYKIASLTLGSDELRTFIPGKGFTEISYHHNGSVSEYSAYLESVEYIQGKQ